MRQLDIKSDLKVRNVLRIAVYIRVSTLEQANNNYSIGEQTERLQNYCKAMNWEIFKIYVDPGYSGANTDRPGLKSMIADVEAGLVDKVVVYKLDRLSRSQLDTLDLIENTFLKHSVDFVSMLENFDTSTPFGRAMIGILAVFAQLEREQFKERSAMGKEGRAKKGKFGGGRNIPIGYNYDKVTELLTINDYEAMQYLELVDLFLAGKSFRAIEDIFDKKGYRHKSGKWIPKTMRSVLRSKIYLGYISYKKVWHKAEHDPLIDEETYDKIVALLDQRAETYKQTGGRAGVVTTYLGGMLFCKHCGGKYGKDSNNKRDKDGNKVYYYRCYSRSKKMKSLIKDPNCKNKTWRVNALDEIIFDEIRKLATDPNYMTMIQDEKLRQSDNLSQVDIIKKEIHKIDEQISRFMDLYGIGKFTIDQVSSKVDPLNEQRRALEKEMNVLVSESGAISDDDALDVINSFGDILDRGDFDEIRLAIESLIYYIELDDEDIIIHWRFA